MTYNNLNFKKFGEQLIMSNNHAFIEDALQTINLEIKSIKNLKKHLDQSCQDDDLTIHHSFFNTQK